LKRLFPGEATSTTKPGEHERRLLTEHPEESIEVDGMRITQVNSVLMTHFSGFHARPMPHELAAATLNGTPAPPPPPPQPMLPSAALVQALGDVFLPSQGITARPPNLTFTAPICVAHRFCASRLMLQESRGMNDVLGTFAMEYTRALTELALGDVLELTVESRRCYNLVWCTYFPCLIDFDEFRRRFPEFIEKQTFPGCLILGHHTLPEL